MSVKVNRRKFLKMLGWGGAGTALTGCDLPTTVTLEEGKEEVVSYLMPEEYAIPGIGVWYASTCTQCEAGCGLHGRVREGRVLKVEGNPDSPVNHGKSCMMGQSTVQAHYNPDRITSPMMRKGSTLQAVSWDEAMSALTSKIGPDSGVKGDRVGMVTGTVSGHQAVIIDELLAQVGSKNHYVHEVINTSVWSSVCRDMLGDEMPKLNFDKAGVILSFGADFLGTWISPVHNMGEYAKFRKGARGSLIQVEPKMTLTGGNADLWVPAKPGTEGALALGIANFILERGWNAVDVPSSVGKSLSQYTLTAVEKVTGVPVSKIKRIASMLTERGPSLVIAGASTENHENGYDAVASVMLLNLVMGNIGKTIEASAKFPEKALRAKQGNTKDLLLLAKALKDNKLDVLFTYNTNPAFTAPAVLQVSESLSGVGFKVAFSMFPDETTLQADLVLPIHSGMEDWGTHVPAYQPDTSSVLSLQQPLMEPIHKETRGFGDIMLSLLKLRNKDFGKFADYYSYLQTAVANMPADVTSNVEGASKDIWTNMLQKGIVKAKVSTNDLSPKLVDMKFKVKQDNSGYPMHLVPSARLGLWDGRHANIPWLQEFPDQIAKVVWGSWAELHPKKAAELGVKNGDYVRVTSASGSIETQVYIHKGIHPDAVSVPLGQGHDEFGRYAKGRGVNPLKILNPLMERRTGELATHATRVKVTNAHRHEKLVHLGGSESQVGRKFVKTISVDQLRRTEGEA